MDHLKAASLRREAELRGLDPMFADTTTDDAAQPKAQATIPSYTEATQAVLEKAGRSLKVREILAHLTKAGRPINTSKPYRTLYKVLRSRSDLFEKDNSKWLLHKSGVLD